MFEKSLIYLQEAQRAAKQERQRKTQGGDASKSFSFFS